MCNVGALHRRGPFIVLAHHMPIRFRLLLCVHAFVVRVRGVTMSAFFRFVLSSRACTMWLLFRHEHFDIHGAIAFEWICAHNCYGSLRMTVTRGAACGWVGRNASTEVNRADAKCDSVVSPIVLRLIQKFVRGYYIMWEILVPKGMSLMARYNTLTYFAPLLIVLFHTLIGSSHFVFWFICEPICELYIFMYTMNQGMKCGCVANFHSLNPGKWTIDFITSKLLI